MRKNVSALVAPTFLLNVLWISLSVEKTPSMLDVIHKVIHIYTFMSIYCVFEIYFILYIDSFFFSFTSVYKFIKFVDCLQRKWDKIEISSTFILSQTYPHVQDSSNVTVVSCFSPSR